MNGKEREDDLDREIRSHLDLEAEESGRHGAQRKFGNTTLIKEDVRKAWGWVGLGQFFQDVRYGLRQVRRNPGFSAIAIATLALGIGANTAMFSAVDAVLIRPLPYADAVRLVVIWEDASRIGFAHGTPAPGTWREWRRLNSVFSDIAATRSTLATLSGDGEPEQLPGRKVTANFWTVLGARPLLGRVFTEDEDAHRAPVAVISYGLWQRRLAELAISSGARSGSTTARTKSLASCRESFTSCPFGTSTYGCRSPLRRRIFPTSATITCNA